MLAWEKIFLSSTQIQSKHQEYQDHIQLIISPMYQVSSSLRQFTSSKSGRLPATVVSSSTLFLCFSDNGARGESFTSHRLNFSLTSCEYEENPTWAAMLALWTGVHCGLDNGTALHPSKRFPKEKQNGGRTVYFGQFVFGIKTWDLCALFPWMCRFKATP